MANKRELILEYIIREYINNPEPIGSEYLKLRLDIKISSATIRNYFKKMVEDGQLEQPHISAGRIPSNEVLQHYWQDKLLPLEPIDVPDISHLTQSAKEVGLLCLVRFFKPNKLKEVIAVQNRYLLTVFEEGEIVIDYSPEMEVFVKQMLFMDIMDIRKVADQVKAYNLRDKIDDYIQKNPIERGGEELINVAREADIAPGLFDEVAEGRVMDKVDEGLYFTGVVPEGYLAVKQNIVIKESDAKLFFLGKLHKNFERFYQITRKENDGTE